jgi:DNA polymerase III subunit epsilon
VTTLGSWFRGFSRVRVPRSPHASLDADLSAALARWRENAPADLRGPLSAQRWLVVDVETTGLDMQRGRLLAIGAVVMQGSTIRFEESFEIVIKQAAVSATDNILIHHIPGSEQLEGADAPGALVDFLLFAKTLPCVAFHAAFDETMLKRAIAESLGFDWSTPFLDLALLAPALVHDAPASLHSLDEWIAHFGITIGARHRAIADALGTAQLFQVLLNRAAAQQIGSAGALFKLARDQRWLAGACPG